MPPLQVVRALELPPAGEVIRGIRIEAVHVFETPERKPDDEVSIVHFRTEGLHVVFLGDLGHELTEAELAPLRGADIVLVPAGGPPTIDFPLIPPLLDVIGPRLVLPMHYKTPKINLNIQPLERFLDVLPEDAIVRPGSSKLEVNTATLPEKRTIVVLDHAR